MALITTVDNIFVHKVRLNLSFTPAIVHGHIRPCLPSFLTINNILAVANMRLLKQRIQINDKTILNFQILLENGTRESVYIHTDTNSMF
jgi:hypothetical protein